MISVRNRYAVCESWCQRVAGRLAWNENFQREQIPWIWLDLRLRNFVS
jgi:hypothetical protein